MATMLPDAIEREREQMLLDSMHILETRGLTDIQAHEMPGYKEPMPVTVPVLNITLHPDIHATFPDGHEALVLVEPSTDLSDEGCGRRWQALQTWARQHRAEVMVFVHPEDKKHADDIARHWHLTTDMLEVLPPTH